MRPSFSPSYLMPVSFMHLYAAPAAKVVLDLTAHTPAEIKIVEEGQRCLVLTCFFHGTLNGPVKHNWYHYNKWLSTSSNGLQLIENSKILQEGNLYDFSYSPDQTSGSTRSYLTINEGMLYFFKYNTHNWHFSRHHDQTSVNEAPTHERVKSI